MSVVFGKISRGFGKAEDATRRANRYIGSKFRAERLGARSHRAQLLEHQDSAERLDIHSCPEFDAFGNNVEERNTNFVILQIGKTIDGLKNPKLDDSAKRLAFDELGFLLTRKKFGQCKSGGTLQFGAIHEGDMSAFEAAHEAVQDGRYEDAIRELSAFEADVLMEPGSNVGLENFLPELSLESS